MAVVVLLLVVAVELLAGAVGLEGVGEEGDLERELSRRERMLELRLEDLGVLEVGLSADEAGSWDAMAAAGVW
jgi:hypothetical protein